MPDTIDNDRIIQIAENIVSMMDATIEVMLESFIKDEQRKMKRRSTGAFEPRNECALQSCRNARQMFRESRQKLAKHGFEALANETQQRLARIDGYLRAAQIDLDEGDDEHRLDQATQDA